MLEQASSESCFFCVHAAIDPRHSLVETRPALFRLLIRQGCRVEFPKGRAMKFSKGKVNSALDGEILELNLKN